MRYKNVQEFIRGIFEDDGTEARKADNFLTKCHNADIDITGRLKSRYGYEDWIDLLEENSITSGQNIPEIGVNPGDEGGFPARIQRMLQYTDVSGARYVVIVCQGKIYVETLEDNGRQWSCLTPNFQFEVVDKHLDIVAYFDLLFFNDVAHNIYYYDSQSYVKGQGWISFGNRFIYFAGDTVYFRNYSDFSADFSTLIEDANPANPEGQEIYDGLDAISYPYLADLKLGYCIRTGNDDIGYRYYVLDNAKNQRADDKCQIIKFNDRLIAQDYVEFDINADADILNFAFHVGDFEIDGHLYIFVDDGKIYSIDESNLDTELLVQDASHLTAPTNTSGKKQYSIAVSAAGIFVYTVTLPNKGDWYQPVMAYTVQFWSSYAGDYRHSTRGAHPNFPQWVWSGEETYSNEFIMAKDLARGIDESFYCGYSRYYWPYGGWNNSVFYVWANNQGIGVDFNHVPILSLRKTLTDDSINNAIIGYGSPSFPFYGYRRYSNIYMANAIALQDTSLDYDVWFISDPWDLTKSIMRYGYWEYASQDNWNASEVEMWDYDGGNQRWNRYNDSFDLIGAWHNTEHFNSITSSKVLLLAGLNFDGTLKYKDVETVDEGQKKWRYLLPCGMAADLQDAMPIMIHDNQVSFGNKFADDAVIPNYSRGMNWSVNIDTLERIYYPSFQITNIMLVEDDNRFMFYDEQSGEYVISADWRGWNRIVNYSDWNTHIDNYNSNVCFHIYKQSVDIAGNNQIDKIQRLGTPSIPQVNLDYESPSSLTSGKKLKYYTAFQFYGGTTSPLSSQSFEISITNNTSKVIISNINHKDIYGYDIYDKDDIEKIQLYRSTLEDEDPTGEWTAPILIATLEKDGGGEWYYNPVLPPYAAETFEDSDDTYPYNPWTESNAIVYPVEDIFLHKNRLILINKTNEVNSNVSMYSDLDRARAIPPDNVRPIESGDGDRLTGGISTGDYAYVFKEKKIYAVLGDYPTGQLIDISRTIGTRYKNLKTVYGGVVYFMNDNGIFRIAGPRPPENMLSERLKNYFNKNRDDCINFEYLKEHGFVDVDVEKREIRWHVPQKKEGETEVKNNFCIIYNIEYDFFRTYSYYDNIYDEAYMQNIGTEEYEYLMATYDGKIYRRTKNKSDDNKPIRWLIRTKEFNIGSDTFTKIYKTIEVAGRYLQNLHVAYWIDGERFEGELFERRNMRGLDSVMAKIWTKGKARRMMIELSGEQLNQPRTEIEEINIGYNIAKGSRF